MWFVASESITYELATVSSETFNLMDIGNLLESVSEQGLEAFSRVPNKVLKFSISSWLNLPCSRDLFNWLNKRQVCLSIIPILLSIVTPLFAGLLTMKFPTFPSYMSSLLVVKCTIGYTYYHDLEPLTD